MLKKALMLKRMTLILILGLLIGCASTPNVMYSYYPSLSNTTVTVTQTIDCNSDQTALIVLNSATVNTLYSADYSKGPYSVQIKKLDGFLADSDVGFNFFEDGRLKSINASTTGQGETILKSAIALGAALAPLGGGARPAKEAIPECAAVKSWGNGKPVTLIYSKNIDYRKDDDGKTHPFGPPQGAAALYTELNKSNLLPLLEVVISPPSSIKSGASYISSSSDSSDDVVLLTLQETANVKVDVLASGQDFWSSKITIPGKNTYSLPIPKAALFGKDTFSLTLSEAGAITQIEYGKNTGAAGPLNVATSAAGAAAPGSTADKAAQIKAQADLIAQQQRLARCEANPAQCQ